MSQSREDHHPMTERIPEAPLYKAARQATLDHVANLREWFPKPHQVNKYIYYLDCLLKTTKYKDTFNYIGKLIRIFRCGAADSFSAAQSLMLLMNKLH